ncbi:Trehalose-phosphate phosphatase A [Glycine max]|nr:Trehalose-phosphate phosphatase A [Glycine max]KAH1248237.1 Trehalose-phosphate phosphatase A [Glycine max]
MKLCIDLDPMDPKPNLNPVLTDATPLTRSRLGVPSGLSPYSPKGATFPHGTMLAIPRKKTGILDDFRSSGWLDAMKSSSPTHNKVSKDLGHGIGSPDAAYSTWLLKFPSALASFDQITNCAKGKRIALFLDYDGTLSPIVDNPDCAFMSDNMRAAVKKVAEYFPTAIISGRSRDKVYEFVGLSELYYAGSHGMDIIGPPRQSNSDNHPDCIRSSDQQLDADQLIFEQVRGLLKECIKDIEGATVENNKFCVSVHYRNVDEESWQIVGQHVYDILKEYPRLRVTHGRKVLEVRPVIDWDKGKAVTFLLESLGLNNCDDVLAIYVGDDRTDEDAFKVLREVNKGCGILVSPAPKESNAIYSLRDPCEVILLVMEFLTSLAVWKSSIQAR